MTLIALFLALTPLALEAQAIDPAQLPAEAQQVLAEMQQVQAEIQPIQQQALADTALQAEQAALGAQVQAAMEAADPNVPQHIERLQELADEAEVAQNEEDEERFREILTEAQVLEMSLQEAQTTALQSPEVASRIEAFQRKVQARMLEVNPEADELLARFAELESRMVALMSQPE